MKKGGIYQILNLVNNKRYIGSTNDFIKRKSYHFVSLSKNSHPNKHLQNSYNKHGKSNFKFEILEVIFDENILSTREQYFYDYFKSNRKNAYNIRIITESNRGIKNGPLSDEHKNKISKANKGKKRSSETCKLLSEIGKKIVLKKFIYSQKGRIRPSQEKECISKTMKLNGIKPSDEIRLMANIAHRKKISQYTLDNVFIRDWDSSREAALYLKLNYKNISSNLRGKSKSCGGFIWKYKEA
jgi:group I intron endonuclease